MSYHSEMCRAMTYLGNMNKTLFIGQAVAVPGTAMTTTLGDVPDSKKIELPVAEEMQMGMSIGLSLGGFIPVSIYPRWNFLLLATNQLVNHLDKIPTYSAGGYTPGVIIRTSIGSVRPLHPQSQHVGDYTEAFRLMLTNIAITRLDESEDIFPSYVAAYNAAIDGRSTIIVEHADFLNEK